MFFQFNTIIPNNKNIIINGIKTKNQAIPVPVGPSLHIKFKIQVQKATYNNFIKNMSVVLCTSQE